MVEGTFDQARRMGAPRAQALCLNFGGALEFQSGRWSEAERSLRDAVTLYRELRSGSGEALSLQRLGVVLTARGRLDEGWDTLVEGIAVAEHATMRSHCLTRLHATMARNRLAASDEAAAAKALQEGEIVARRHGACVTCNALLLPEAVRVRLAEGRHDDAETHAAELERMATEYGSSAWTAMARHARARVLAARDRHGEAVAAYREGREAYERIGVPYEAARCLLGEAKSLRRLGNAASARTLEDRAAAVFSDLGAAGLES